MDVIPRLVSLIPREEVGSNISRKYSFQHDLSLYLLLINHEKAEDYVYLFDFHDDLMILDSCTNPQKIDFYQIKSKDKGNWTLNELLKSEKDKKTKEDKLSIIGKMYLNKLNFPDNTNSLIFISNAPFSIKHLKSKEDSTKKTIIRASDLDRDCLSLCINKIKEEHSVADLVDFEDITQFEVTKLSNQDSSTHCLGELSKLIYKLNPSNKINPQLAYNQIKGEILRKTNAVTSDKNINSIEELIEIKGISKNIFEDFLNKAGLYKSVEDEWNDVKLHLQSNGIGIIELLKYQKSFRDVSIKLINDVNKIPLIELKNKINELLSTGEAEGCINDNTTLIGIIEYCESNLISYSSFYDKYFIRCLIIKVLYEKY